jgi:hypothetical protein
MITFNNIVAKFQEFCDNHFFIKTFSYGSPSDVDLDKFEQYPLMHLVYTGGDYNTERTKTYNLEIYILTLPPAEADKNAHQKESISDAEQVAEDILADIENGGDIFQFGYHYDLTSASVTPLEEERSNALAGCLLDLTIAVPYSYDSCNAPLTGVEPEGSTPQSYRARGLLRVRETDGSPDVLSVATINVPNGSLTDDGDGEITLNFGVDPVTTVASVSYSGQFPDVVYPPAGGTGFGALIDIEGPTLGAVTIVNAGGIVATYTQVPTASILFSNVPQGRTFTITATFDFIMVGILDFYNVFVRVAKSAGPIANATADYYLNSGVINSNNTQGATYTFISDSFTSYTFSFYAQSYYGDVGVRITDLSITCEA